MHSMFFVIVSYNRIAICFFIFVQMTQSRIRREAFVVIPPESGRKG